MSYMGLRPKELKKTKGPTMLGFSQGNITKVGDRSPEPCLGITGIGPIFEISGPEALSEANGMLPPEKF